MNEPQKKMKKTDNKMSKVRQTSKRSRDVDIPDDTGSGCVW